MSAYTGCKTSCAPFIVNKRRQANDCVLRRRPNNGSTADGEISESTPVYPRGY